LYVLFSSIAVSINNGTNQNSANFALIARGAEAGNMEGIWFTGDSTGLTFLRFMQNADLCEAVSRLFRGCNPLFMTVPHHGSIHTLCEFGFAAPESQSVYGISYTSPNLEILLGKKIGFSPSFILSAGAQDRFQHPSGQAMKIYGELSTWNISQKECERYRVFYDQEEPAYMEPDGFENEESYTQFIKNRWIRATCYFYHAVYWHEDYYHKWEDFHIN